MRVCRKVDDDKGKTGDKPPLFAGEPRFAILRALWNCDRSRASPKLYIHVIYPRPYFQTHTYRTYKFPISSIPFIEAVSADFARHMIAHPTKAQFIVD